MLKMALVICIPLVLLIGTYDLKTVMTVSCVQFALFFVDFWFQLARWIDSTILDALYGWGFGADRPHTNFDPLIGLNNAYGDMLLNRSEEHTYDLQSLKRISETVICLQHTKNITQNT